MLAFVSQLALGAIALPDMPQQAGLAALEAAMVLCQSGAAHPGTDGGPGPQREQHEHGCALCPLAAALALPAAIPVADAVLPGPGAAPASPRASVPPARAPPSARFATAYPRGPPALA